MGTSVPNRPSISPLRPAVKNNVVLGPAPPPLQNPITHNPSMVRIELFGFRVSPKKGLNRAADRRNEESAAHSKVGQSKKHMKKSAKAAAKAKGPAPAK
jgi:hypothetical protein